MAEDKTCFIIMPITTPDSAIESYRDQADHFKHVLDCLFKPAIHKAGYKPIPPIAKGADLIHADIIKNLETSDIVLCDMSCLNPNVFFEFGIRTSLNKPVSIVKDNLTKKVPFDTGIINHHEYQSSLDPWLLESEINKLSEHIIASDKRSQNQNTLWKYFGLKSEAVPYQGEKGSDAKLDYLAMQFESLRSKLDSVIHSSETREYDSSLLTTMKIQEIFKELMSHFPSGATLEAVSPDSKRVGGVIVYYSGSLSDKEAFRLKMHIWKQLGIRTRFLKADSTLPTG